MITRYDFYDCFKMEKLPEDVNGYVEEKVQGFKNENLLKMLKDAREKQYFGEAVFSDPKTGLIMAKFDFHKGMIKKFDLIKYYGKEKNAFMLISNKNLGIDFRRNKNNSIKEK